VRLLTGSRTLPKALLIVSSNCSTGNALTIPVDRAADDDGARATLPGSFRCCVLFRDTFAGALEDATSLVVVVLGRCLGVVAGDLLTYWRDHLSFSGVTARSPSTLLLVGAA
jgi:hypothetical protein